MNDDNTDAKPFLIVGRDMTERGTEFSVFEDPKTGQLAGFKTRKEARAYVAKMHDEIRQLVRNGKLPPGEFTTGIMSPSVKDREAFFKRGGPDVVTMRAEARPKLVTPSAAASGPGIK